MISFFYLFKLRLECKWTQKDGYYVEEGQGTTGECYGTLEDAKDICMSFKDCHAVATQSNICSGKYRVSHGGPTFSYYSDWNTLNLRAWARTCKGRIHLYA